MPPQRWNELPKPTPPPDCSVAVVAHDDEGKLIGTMYLVSPAHLEGAWVDFSKRGGWVLHRLVNKAEELSKKAKLSKLFAYAVDAKMENYLERLGYKKTPMTVWEKGLG